LAERFEIHRASLQAMAYRMVGSLSEAEDAVQEAWLRLYRSDARQIDNLRGWLTTVVGRLCLDILRTRKSRREESLEGLTIDAMPKAGDGTDPEREAILADSVGLALLVVLDTLAPAERLALVLHDMFGVPFDEIASIVERSPVAAKKLASRARRRLQGRSTVPLADLGRQQQVVEAFLAAARSGNMRALLAVLDPDVVRRADTAAWSPGIPVEIRGALVVAEETRGNMQRARFARPALVNGAIGIIVAPQGRLLLVLDLTIADDRITRIEVVADRAPLRDVELSVLDVRSFAHDSHLSAHPGGEV
jgi:RNA polymerase sigma factor (sigma-70 family)